MDHIPHEVRHTFITRAKEAGVDEYCLKLIIGHNVNDVTERVYTHRTVENLRREIEKNKVKEKCKSDRDIILCTDLHLCITRVYYLCTTCVLQGKKQPFQSF